MTYSSALFNTSQESLEKLKLLNMLVWLIRWALNLVTCFGNWLWVGWICRVYDEEKAKSNRFNNLKRAVDMLRKELKQGLSDEVNLKLQDYRDETGVYDGVASIEMFEAVGEYWPVCFDKIKQCLKPQQATLQIITIQDARWEVYRKTSFYPEVYFSWRYVTKSIRSAARNL